MSQPPFYTGETIKAQLDYDGCIAAVRKAMMDFTASGREQPLRTIVPIGPKKLYGVMPGLLDAPGGFGAKLVAAFEDPNNPGRVPHQGVAVLFDHETGAVTALADAAELTEIRTAAASAMATDVLARPDARRLTILGNGAQAASHAQAIARVRPLESITICGRSLDKAQTLANALSSELVLTVHATTDGEAATANADIICTVTTAAQPILFGAWVRPGTHVNVVGSSYAGPVEVDTDLVVKSRYIADSRRSVIAAGSEYLVAKDAGLIDESHIVAEIGEVLLGAVAGRTRADDVTLYKSLGHIVQDLASLHYLRAKLGASS
jgi:ornithine cyclodeaminase